MKTLLVGVVLTLAVAFVPACGGISSSETAQPAAGSGGGGTGGGSGGAGGTTSTGGSGGVGATGGSVDAGIGGTGNSGGAAGIGGQGGSGGIGGTGGSATCGALTTCGPLEQSGCAEATPLCVAKLVPVPGGYSIDATEVTGDQYESWLSTNPSTSSQPSYCSWNESYTPSCKWPPGSKGAHPVVCVDWCDAYAYCAGVGKRLCGGIGGGMSAFDAHADATNSQWFNACSSGGVNDYPYGSTYAGETCNGPELEGIATVEVGSMGGCQSLETEYAGVFDLSGNVWEWEDSCDADYGKFDSCRLRGGSFFPGDCIYCGSSFLRCDWDQYGFRDIAFADVDTIGFRCCSSP